MIQFQCPHCRQSLRVPESRADTEAVCPGCHQSIRVPPLVNSEDQQGSSPAPPPIITTHESVDVAETVVSGDSDITTTEPVMVSETIDQGADDIVDTGGRRVEVSDKHFDDLAASANRDHAPNPHQDKIHRHTQSHAQLGISRSTIYIFAALLGFVAFTSFWLGSVMNPVEPEQPLSEVPGSGLVECRGRVTFRTTDDPEAIDAGALVFLLPEESLPSEKFPVTGLEVGVEVPDTLATIQEIRRLGGEFVITDSQGQFAVQIGVGRYYLLVLSAGKELSGQPTPDDITKQNQNFKEMMVYFDLPAKLVATRQYRWSLEVINTNREIRIYFR